MNDFLVSLIRTYTPIVAGYLVSLALSAGFQVDSAQAETLLTGASIAGYYALVRYLERKWPAVGWLLGSPRKPTYL